MSDLEIKREYGPIDFPLLLSLKNKDDIRTEEESKMQNAERKRDKEEGAERAEEQAGVS